MYDTVIQYSVLWNHAPKWNTNYTQNYVYGEISILNVNWILDEIPAGTWRLYNVAATSSFIQRRFNVDAASWRCIDVDATLYKRHVPAEMTFIAIHGKTC